VIDEHYNRFAGKILRSTLYDAGAELLPLKKYKGEPLKNAILIKSPGKADKIAEGGFRLQIKNGSAVIIAARPCGSEFGVLALWEKLGIRYFVTNEVIKLKPEFKAAATDETVIPGIPNRYSERHWHGERIGFSSRSSERAYYHFISPGEAVHPLPYFLCEAEFGKTHPEYFALQANGTRSESRVGGHLCTTNPDVIRIVSDRLMGVIAKHPESQYFPMYWGDGADYACRCENCQKVGIRNLNLLFINNIAKRVGKKYPKAKILLHTGWIATADTLCSTVMTFFRE